MSAAEIDAYLEALDDPDQRRSLQRLREQIIAVLPDAEQGLSYGVPAFRSRGKLVAGFSAARKHSSYLPHSGSVLGSLDPRELEGFAFSKGALRFGVDGALPDALVERLIAARLAEIAS